MFAYVKGTLVHATPNNVVIETTGIGYKIFIPASAFGPLPQIGESITLHTSFVVRELAQTLYGFHSPQERDFFDALMGVTGVGPKIALALIGHMPLRDLQHAIANEDTTTICRVPGIGKKGAERLIIEMRDKVGAALFASGGIDMHAVLDRSTQHVNDAMSALINLGYTHSTAQKAMKKTLKEAPESADAALLISTALKHV